MTHKTARDYSLVGLDTKRAEENVLATAEWYHTPIPRARMKEFMQRKDGPAISCATSCITLRNATRITGKR